MAKVRFNKVSFRKKLKSLSRNKKMWEKVGRFSVKRIRETTRTGDTLATGRALKEITDNTAIRKQRLIDIAGVRASKFYAFGISNLTFTGQLLNALTFKVKGKLNGIFIDTKDSRRRGHRGLRDRKIAQGMTNREVSKKVQDDGRPYIGMDDKGEKEIAKIITRSLSQAIRKLNRKK